MKGTGRKNLIRVLNRPHARVSLLQRSDKGVDHHAGSQVSKEVQASQPSAGRRCGLPRTLFQLRAYRVPSTILLHFTAQSSHRARRWRWCPGCAPPTAPCARFGGGGGRASVCEEQVGGAVCSHHCSAWRAILAAWRSEALTLQPQPGASHPPAAPPPQPSPTLSSSSPVQVLGLGALVGAVQGGQGRKALGPACLGLGGGQLGEGHLVPALGLRAGVVRPGAGEQSGRADPACERW